MCDTDAHCNTSMTTGFREERIDLIVDRKSFLNDGENSQAYVHCEQLGFSLKQG